MLGWNLRSRPLLDHAIVHMQQGDEHLGTGVFAQLNIVHVKYRGFFVERFICCGNPLREVQCSSVMFDTELCRDFSDFSCEHSSPCVTLTVILMLVPWGAAVCCEALCEGLW